MGIPMGPEWIRMMECSVGLPETDGTLTADYPVCSIGSCFVLHSSQLRRAVSTLPYLAEAAFEPGARRSRYASSRPALATICEVAWGAVVVGRTSKKLS